MPILDSDQMVDRPEPTLTGLVLNEKYALQTRIGRGGMGEVYLARDTHLGRKVALKIIKPNHLGDDDSINRFLMEARMTARFNHPHIITIFGVGIHFYHI